MVLKIFFVLVTIVLIDVEILPFVASDVLLY